MKRYGRAILGLALVVAVVAGYRAWSGRGQEVEVVAAQKGRIARTVADTGYVRNADEARLYAPSTARVARLPVELGREVKAGEVAVRLADPDLELQILQLKSRISGAEAERAAAEKAAAGLGRDLAEARRELERVDRLAAGGAVPAAELEAAAAAVAKLEMELEAQALREQAAARRVRDLGDQVEKLRARAADLVVKSPISGIVLELPVEEGQVVTAGALLAAVAPPGRLEVRVDILAEEMGPVKPGQKALVTGRALGDRTLAGRVVKIDPRAVERVSALGVAQRRVPVTVALEDGGGLRPGYEVEVAIETEARDDALLVPRGAVVAVPGGGQEVMVVAGGRVHRRTVLTGIADRMWVEVVSGLEEGEEVVRDGGLRLQEGTAVVPVRRALTSH